MKKLIFLLMAFMLMTGCNNTAKQAKETAADNPNAEWVEVKLNVEGMTCEGCENAIKAGVENLEGIASVESSFEEGWTRVKYDKSTTSVEDIEGKITDTGYTVKDDL